MSTELPFLDLDAIEEKEPSCAFQLNGRTWHVKHRDDLPVDLFLRLSAASEGTKPGEKLAQVGPFFESAIVDAEVDDFMAELNGPRSKLNTERYKALMQHITEQVLRRPTVRPEGSSDGATSTPGSSEAAPSLPDSAQEPLSA